MQFSKGTGYSKADLKEFGTPIILYGRLYTKYETVIVNVDTFADAKQGSVSRTLSLKTKDVANNARHLLFLLLLADYVHIHFSIRFSINLNFYCLTIGKRK